MYPAPPVNKIFIEPSFCFSAAPAGQIQGHENVISEQYLRILKNAHGAKNSPICSRIKFDMAKPIRGC
jgi:hypothetical protein